MINKKRMPVRAAYRKKVFNAVEKVFKDLGLIDGLGNAEQILRKKFGDKVVVKKFEKTKGWLAKKLSSSENQIDSYRVY